LAGSIDSLDPSRTTVVVCRSGNRSELASLMLQARGFTTHNLERGLEQWHAEGLPLVTDDGSAGRIA
jgi:rhodanese-related sulfurtransferase